MYAPDAISCHCSQIIKTDHAAIGPRLGFAYSYNDKTVFRGGFGIMYTRRGAVGGRENARTGTGFTGINANAPIVSPNGSFIPALFWESGIPPFAKGPIYDQTYQTGFATGLPSGGTLTYGNPNSVPPRYTNWNLSIQRSLTRSTILTAAYVGSIGKSLAGAAPGFWTNQMDPKFLVLGNLLTLTATPANVAAAAAIVPGIKLPFANFSGTIGQMLKPWPQYTSISAPYNNDGQLNYQALQASIQQRLTNGLTFNVNYTYSKSLGTINGFRSAYIGEKISQRPTSRMSGTRSTRMTCRLVRGASSTRTATCCAPSSAAGRSLVLRRYASGTPLGPFTATCNVPQAGTCWASYNPAFTGPVQINGGWGHGDVNTTAYIDKNAFISPASFTYGNTPATGAYGLRNPHFANQDLSISRNFQIREGWRLQFGADTFNLLNSTRFGGISTNITAANFGRVSSQANLPRVVQFKLRLLY